MKTTITPPGSPEGQPDRTWLLEQFSQRNLTQAAVAKEMGVDPAGLNITLRGRRKLNLNELSKLSELLHLPAAEIMARWGFPVPLDTPHVPLTCYARDDCSVDQAVKPFISVPAPPGISLDGYAIHVKSSDAADTFWNGLIAFFSQGAFDPIHCLGQLCVVSDTDGRSWFGLLARGLEPETFAVKHPANGRCVQGLTVASCAPAAWFRAS